MEWIVPAARILLSLIFLSAGFGKIRLWSFHLDVSQKSSVPLPKLTLPITIAIDLVGAVALISGVYAGPTALLLSFYVFVVTIIFYARWFGQVHWWYDQMSQTFKNSAIIGGLLLVAHIEGLGTESFWLLH